MKLAILAAGKGTRMLPLTKKRPKPLLKVNKRPFLYYLLKNVKAAGFSDISLVVGYKGKMIKDWANKNNYNITFVKQEKQNGTAHAISKLKSWSGKEDFAAVTGDNLFSPNDLKKLKENDNFCYVLGQKKDPRKKFGELIFDNKHLLKEIKEKPKIKHTGIINTGAYKFTNDIFDAIKKIDISKRGELEITDALTLLAKEKKVKVKILDDYWIDFGSKEDIGPTEKFVKKNFI